MDLTNEVGVLKTFLRLDDLLEGLIGPRKAVNTHGFYLLQWKDILKSSKGKGKAHGEESRRNQGPASRCPLPVQHHRCAQNLLRDGSTWECCQPAKFPGALVSRGSVTKAQSHSTLMREDISGCQSSSPRSWPRTSPEDKPFLRTCEV